jgi:signal transduction histidine kinase
MAATIIPIRNRRESRGGALQRRRASLLEERNRAFLRLASHELRTPLNSVIGFSEILAGELCGPLGAPQYKEYAENVRQSGHKLLRLVNQMLEIARLENGVADLHAVSEGLDHAIDDALVGLGKAIALKDLRVAIGNEGELPLVRADPRGLRTVLGNLLQNAVTASPHGGEIRLRAVARAGQVELSIEDDGPGVLTSDIPRLLRPFEQGDSSPARSADGAGLGLPIARLLCRNMGGGLRLQCEPGTGLRAVVVLPAG